MQPLDNGILKCKTINEYILRFNIYQYQNQWKGIINNDKSNNTNNTGSFKCFSMQSINTNNNTK